MSHYSLWLTGPAILGVPLQIYVVAINNFSSRFQIAFAVFIVIWAVIMLEFWKRKEKMTSIEWGMTGFEDEEVNRPGLIYLFINIVDSKQNNELFANYFWTEFKGEVQKSLINGKEVMYFPPKKRMVLIAQSSGVIATLILVVVGAVRISY